LKDGVFGYDDFLSPFTWRYGSPQMRRLFSEKGRRATWRRVWLALAEAESDLGLVSKKELDGIRAHAGREHVDIKKAHVLEKSIRHDLMAELRTFAAQAGPGGGKLHLGAISMDIEDNADMMIFAEATEILMSRIADCLQAFRAKIVRHKGTVCMGWTHLQPAEPTTLGYRLASYAQDLVMDLGFLETVRTRFLKGKGVKGAVGTSASFMALVGSSDKVRKLEGDVMKKIGMEPFEVATQTYPRKADFLILVALASIAESSHKFGLDPRVMQSPGFGELSEPIVEKQVGSSAMPFKRNPVSAERMCSLARFVSVLPMVAFNNAANSILERTLDDSASRRIVIPEAFLAVDECLAIYERLLDGLQVFPEMIRRNLEMYGPFAGTEALMMKLVARGGDRQKIHEKIRVKSFAAWAQVMKGKANPLEKLLAADKSLASGLTAGEIHRLLEPARHVGDAAERCESFARGQIDPMLKKYKRKGKRKDSGARF